MLKLCFEKTQKLSSQARNKFRKIWTLISNEFLPKAGRHVHREPPAGVLSGYEQYLSNYLHLSSYAGNISQKTMISVCLMEDNGYVSMA